MEIEDHQLKALLEAIRLTYGYDFTDYAEASVKRRINHFMLSRKLTDIQQLEKLILTDDKLFEDFIQVISVTVTEMFRDPSFYSSLRELVMKRLATYPFIKIWIAGCATGEEAYSLAVLVAEAIDESPEPSPSVRIFATDLDESALAFARSGVYPAAALAEVPEELVARYFTRRDGEFEVTKAVRNQIVFGHHDLAQRPPFPRIDLILCRNVLIYFAPPLQRRARVVHGVHARVVELVPRPVIGAARVSRVVPPVQPARVVRHREQVVGLAVVDRHPVRVELGRAVRRPRVEGGGLVLRRRRRAEHLRGRGLVEAGVDARSPDRLEQPERADRVGRGGVLRHLEGHLHVALRPEVVDLVRPDGVDQVDQAHPVGEVAVVQVQPLVGVEVVDPVPVQGRGPADQPVHLVVHAEEELREVGAVLSGDAGDEGALGHGGRVAVPAPGRVRVPELPLATEEDRCTW